MNSILDMKMDEIVDIPSSKQKEQGKRIDPDNYYLVEAEGKVLITTENKEEAFSVYRNSQAPNKRVMKVWRGKQFQVMPVTYY